MTDPAPPQGWSDPTRPPPPDPTAPAAGPTSQPAPGPPGEVIAGEVVTGTFIPSQTGYPQPQYGQPPYGMPGYGQPVYQAPPPRNSLALASLLLSLAGLLTVGISAPIGAFLGHSARKKIKQTGESGDGMAKAGIIVGWILTGLWLAVCGLCILGAVLPVTTVTN